MERSPVLSWLFHVRAVLLLMFLGMVDAVLVHLAYNTTMQSGASVQLVFGFEVRTPKSAKYQNSRKIPNFIL